MDIISWIYRLFNNNKLVMDKLKYGGLILENIQPFEYEFGGMTPIPKTLLFENGNAIPYLPENEMQVGVYFDTWGCVSFSALNAIETLISRQFSDFNESNRAWLLKNIYKNNKPNFSDRDLVVLSGTKIGTGNTARKVLETSQDKGIISEAKAPWDFTNRDPKVNIPEVYYAYNRTDKSESLAQEWNDRFEILGERVARHNWQDASKYGALQVFVNAWYMNNNGEYYNPTGGHNHAVMMADFQTRQIFDSYETNGSFLKTLSSWNDAFGWAYKFNIIEKNMTKPNIINNSLVILVEGNGGIGLYLDGKIIVDNEAKLNSVFMARNSKDGYFSGGPTISLTLKDWNKFEKIDLAGRPL